MPKAKRKNDFVRHFVGDECYVRTDSVLLYVQGDLPVYSGDGDGRIAECGTHSELIQKEGHYKKFTEIREQAEG